MPRSGSSRRVRTPHPRCYDRTFRNPLHGRARHTVPSEQRNRLLDGGHRLRLPRGAHLRPRPQRPHRRRGGRIRRHHLVRNGQRTLLRSPDRPLRQPHRRRLVPARRRHGVPHPERDAGRQARPSARRNEGIRPRDVAGRTAARSRPGRRAVLAPEPRRRGGLSGQPRLHGHLLVDERRRMPHRIRGRPTVRRSSTSRTTPISISKGRTAAM